MPANVVKSVSNKCDMSYDEAEAKWNEAKAKAKEQGFEEQYDYIMSIFTHLVGQDCRKKMGWTNEEDIMRTKIDKYLNEELTYKDVEEFKKDPLYLKVLQSKSKQEFEKNLETLKSVRGSSAVNNLKQILKLMKK